MDANLRLIRSEEDYAAALAEYEAYFDSEPAPATPEGDRFELLGLLLSTYEDKHFPIRPGRPLDAIQFRMEQSGYTQTDLANLLGSRSRASEILSGRREPSLEQIRKLHREWGIPIESLIGATEAA